MRIVIINKRPFAVGLTWATRAIESRHSKKESANAFRKKLADDPENESFNFITFRLGQYGLGKGDNQKIWHKVQSLAADLKVIPTSFLGLFQLRDVNGNTFWWVYALRSGIISAQSDTIFDTQKDAEEHIRVSIEGLLGEFEEKVVCESVDKSIAWLSSFLKPSLFLSRQGRLILLRVPQDRKKKNIVKVVLIAFLLISCAGVYAFLQHKAGQRAIELARQTLMNKEAKRKELMEHPERFFPTPWMTADPIALWSICNPALLSLPLVASGWMLNEATCNGTDVVANWAHQPGASYLILPPQAKLGKSPQEAISQFNISVKLKAGTGVHYKELLTRDEMNRYFYQLTQETASHLKLSSQKKQSKKINEVTITSPWLVGTWELTNIPYVLLFDASLVEALKKPGVLLKSIHYSNKIWTFKGESYVIE